VKKIRFSTLLIVFLLTILLPVSAIAALPIRGEKSQENSFVTIEDLGKLPGGASAQAYCINDAGQIVGYCLFPVVGSPSIFK
jgi:hypothetical protein